MRIGLASVLLVIALVPASASARGSYVATCAQQSTASFPSAGAGDLVFGPLRFVGLRGIQEMTARELRKDGGFKSPALLATEHSATVSIDRAARRFARLRYGHHGPDEPTLASLPHTIRFVACKSSTGQTSYAGGKPVTFWSGFFMIAKSPRCVPLTVRIDHGRVRHWRLPAGRGACGRR